jgi:hypothetical protein
MTLPKPKAGLAPSGGPVKNTRRLSDILHNTIYSGATLPSISRAALTFMQAAVQRIAIGGRTNMSKTLSREVLEELQRYKADLVAPTMRRPETLDRAKIGDRHSSDEISRLVAALIMSTQQALSEDARKSTSIAA